MAYTKQTWTNDVSKLNATRMQYIEDGLEAAAIVADAAVAKSLVDAKGDLLVASAADTVARQAVGANNTLVVADSAQTNGVKWAQLTNAMVDAAAAIAYSKLSLAGSIVNADISGSAAISASKLASYPNDATKYLAGDGTWPSTSRVLIGEIALDSVTAFTSISGSYRMLELTWIARGTGAVTTANIELRFNSDTGANYDTGVLVGNNSAASSSQATGQTLMIIGSMPGASATASRAGYGQALIPGYALTTFHKTVTSVGSSFNTSAAANIWSVLRSGLWLSTSAITRIDILTDATAFASGSKAFLYGVT